jgi:hypothetical protein
MLPPPRGGLRIAIDLAGTVRSWDGGKLVALLDAAPGALRTLRGTVRRWTHLGRQRTAIERANEARGGVHSVQLTVGTWSGGTPAEATEWHSRVWFEAPNH